MHLGTFSLSLAVKDIQISRDFYLKLGFREAGGVISDNWLIMKNGTTVIGLFQDMFQGNILTFNPGWDSCAQNLDEFTDVRDIQKHLKEQGMPLIEEADETTEGPACVSLTDPDGNMILLDQHR